MSKAKGEQNESALKHLFGKALLNRMASSLSKACKDFDSKQFLLLVPKLEALEMKRRVLAIRDELKRQLPQAPPAAFKVLLQSAKDKSLSGFDFWPYTEYIQAYGLEHFQDSLDALKELTKLFTSEFAVRPFLVKYPAQTIDYLLNCSYDPNPHVRRWACEGTRPRLPWGQRLHGFVQDPSPTLRILDSLKYDSEIYVRKSVSNHLNDIAKDHPNLVIDLLGKWKKEAGEQNSIKVEWIIRRSLRTLIKDGNPRALKLIGVSDKPKIEVSNFKVSPKKIKIGERVYLEFQINSLSTKPQKLVVDYQIRFVKAKGKTSTKVFKLKTFTLPAGAKLKIAKSHRIKKITTRDYYSGLHSLELTVNGLSFGAKTWTLKV